MERLEFKSKFKWKNYTCNHACPLLKRSPKGFHWTIILYIFTILLTSTISSLAQENKAGIEFLPSGLNFLPLKANVQEPRLGVLYYTENKNLKVDIGNSIDLIKYNLPEENIYFASGIEFMGYALSTNYKNRRLQIDALDGFFGGNLTFKKNYSTNELCIRLRIIHNSAHFVDGHYDFSEDKWIDNTNDISFSKNFYEITAANQLKTSFGYFKYYGAFLHAFFVRPAIIKRLNMYAGFELAFCNLLGKVFEKDEYFFLTSYYYLAGFEKYIGSQQTMIGIKFGDWNGKGISLYSSYYTGMNYFDAYYGQRIAKFGIGFNVDFL